MAQYVITFTYSIIISIINLECSYVWYWITKELKLYKKLITVYEVSFDGQNFLGFHGFIVNCKSFPAKD